MKIKGLSQFQRTALKKFLPATKRDGNFTIEFNDSVSLSRMSSYWYGGNVVDIIYKDEFEAMLETA